MSFAGHSVARRQVAPALALPFIIHRLSRKCGVTRARTLPSLLTAAVENLTAALGFHPCTKSVFTGAFFVTRLVGSLAHNNLSMDCNLTMVVPV